MTIHTATPECRKRWEGTKQEEGQEGEHCPGLWDRLGDGGRLHRGLGPAGRGGGER